MRSVVWRALLQTTVKQLMKKGTISSVTQTNAIGCPWFWYEAVVKPKEQVSAIIVKRIDWNGSIQVADNNPQYTCEDQLSSWQITCRAGHQMQSHDERGRMSCQIRNEKNTGFHPVPSVIYYISTRRMTGGGMCARTVVSSRSGEKENNRLNRASMSYPGDKRTVLFPLWT